MSMSQHSVLDGRRCWCGVMVDDGEIVRSIKKRISTPPIYSLQSIYRLSITVIIQSSKRTVCKAIMLDEKMLNIGMHC
jgi:hypothetical protein